MDTIIIERMNRRIKWLLWALCVFGLGLMISLSTTAIVEAAIAGSIVLPPAMWWGVMVGLACSALCVVAGIVLAVKGLRAKAK